MELKLFLPFVKSYRKNPFNQTKMELKPGLLNLLNTVDFTFNQTKMELKPLKVTTVHGEIATFNQTKMELKLRHL